MTKPEENKFLRRYTELPALFYMLKNKIVTFLNPMTWDDKNDLHYINKYLEKRSHKTVFVLCFTQKNERFHHWKVFAGNSSGVCIVFKKKLFLNAFAKVDGVRHQQVSYKTIEQMNKNNPRWECLPFLKRKAFEDENEYRVIFETKDSSRQKFEYPIELDCIDKIMLSPWMHEDLRDSMVDAIKSISGCEKMKVFRSQLIDYKLWKGFAENRQ